MSQKFNFESLAVAEKKQSVQDEQNYQNLLREIAADKCTRTDDEVLEILYRAGRDGKTLETDAAERAERDRMIAELKRLPELQAQNDELSAKAQAMRDEFEKVEAEYMSKRNPILWECNRLDATMREIREYRGTLYESCPDTNLKLELQLLEGQHDSYSERALCKRQQEIESGIQLAKQDLEAKVISPDRYEKKSRLKARIKELENEFEQIEIKKAELAKKEAERKAEIDKIREAMIFA